MLLLDKMLLEERKRTASESTDEDETKTIDDIEELGMDLPPSNPSPSF